MKFIATVAITGLIAATSLTSVATPALAGDRHWNGQQWNYNNGWNGGYHHKKGGYHQKKYYSSNNSWNPGAALATGAILGFAFGALATPSYYAPPKVYYPAPPPPPPYPTYYAYGPLNAQHVSYCQSSYRSYNARYNTWIGFDGIVHQCISPYYR